jgi:hypothetical protein
MENILTYLIGIGGIVLLMIAWALIQTLWRQIFHEHLTDSDVLAERRSCGNCGCTSICTRDNEKIKET